MSEPHVVIVGGGFAGLGVMQKLTDVPVKITLIDQNNYHTFQPLLYQLATNELDANQVGFPMREMMHRQDNALFHQARVTDIDLDKKAVLLENMEPIVYDYLVVGLGAVVNFYGTKGAEDYAYPLYTMRDALLLKAHINRVLEAVDKNPALIDEGALNFCVVGGGPTGVETAGALSELLHAVADKDYPNLPINEQAQVILFEAGPKLLGPFKPKLQKYAKKALEKLDVTVRLEEGVSEITPTSITLRSGEVVKTHTLVWGAGVQAHPLAKSLGVEQVRGGRIPVELDLSLNGRPEVFVVGDIALITDAKTKKPLPQLGSVAQQAGRHVGKNIERLVGGKPTEPFEYLDKGTMAAIGRGAAVVQMPGHGSMTGHAAWLAWLGVHVALLAGGEEKSSTIVDWGWNILTQKRGKRIMLTDEDFEAAIKTSEKRESTQGNE
ncbi:MAG: NAD(P)/FAD-dependent oxidoreductase [Anaerolineales bacterium]|nr:NAD(P)/FAD-dependent oxidoreductase [Anaerolineales bacterium]